MTDARFSLIVDSLGTPGVPLAVDYARYRSVNGVPFSGGGAAPAIPVPPAAPVDTAPSVTGTTPANGATGASSTDNLVVTFSEAVNVAAGAFVLQCPAGTPVALTNLTASPATQFTLDPAISLPPTTTCTLTVAASAVTDADTIDPPDTMASDSVATFTTAAESGPVVSSTTPAAGATQIAPGTNLTITFSEPVTVTGNWFQIACATSGTRTVADTAVSGGPSTFTVDPTLDFAPGEACTVTVVAAQVTDQDAIDPPDTMAADFAFGFTTDVAPTVVSTTPANSATAVSTAASLTATFSEPVTVTGNWFQIVCATSGTRNVADTVVSGGPAGFVIDPIVDFAPGELCTVTIVAAQVSDQDSGDPPDTLAANHVFAFTTDTPPSVTATAPGNGAAPTANLTVTFSEPVAVTGNWFQIVCSTSGTRTVGNTAVSGGPTTFTIDPTVDFTPGETCTVTIAAASVSDQDAGDPPDTLTANVVFSFTVEAAPSVTTTTPTTGSTVAITASLTVTFSENVTVAGNWVQIVCTTSGTRNVSDTVVTGGPTIFTINPNVDFTAGESCTATVVGAQVSDQDSNDPPDTLAANHVFSFTIDAAPSVTATIPTNGATVAPAADVTVTFSEAVTVAGSWFQIVCATSGTHTVANTVVSGGPASFVLNPNVDFAAGESCTVTIVAAQVSDQDNADPPDTPAANHVFTFTTDTAPSVTATTPVNGSTTATTTTNLTVTFSEPVAVTGNWFQIVCATSGTRNVTDTLVSGGPTTFTIDPTVNFAAGESCTVTVAAAQVSDQDNADPPDTLTANHVFTFTTDAAPSVTATTPVNGATSTTTTNLTVTFSEPVNVAGNWFQIVCSTSGTRNVADTVVTGGPTTFSINPNADFAQGETCTVTVVAAQVTDQDAADPPDTPAANHVFSFTMDAAPSVTATTPTNGATVALTTDLTITFSEPVNAAGNWFQIVCVTSGTRNVAQTVVTGGPTTFTVNPNVDFSAGESCTVTVFAAQVTDQDGTDPPDTMAANFGFTFAADATPSVNVTAPLNGATQVASNTNLVVGFTEAVNVTGNWFQIVCATTGTRNVADTVVTGGPTSFTVNPNTDFGSGETCTVTVFAAQVTDQDAVDPPDGMAANHVFSFTIDVAPGVTTTVPANGATGIARNATVTVNFSESVNATTASFTLQCPAGSPQAYTLSASPATSFTLTPTALLPAGVICTVTVVAAQVTDTDTGDPPDTMLANFVFSFSVPPDAMDDVRGATGNVSMNTANTGFSVLANDLGPGIAVTAFDAASQRGGVVSVNAAGVFTYNPPLGYEGVDSFTYTISNAAGSDIAVVNLTVSGMLWFINNTAAACTTIAGGCGRLSNPFSTLPAFETVNGGATTNGGDVIDPEAGDHIFIYTGSGNYTAPLTLENNQRVIGQGATSSIVALTGLTLAPDSNALPATGGTKPSITSAGNGINLAQNDQLHGLAFSNTTSTAITGTSNVGTFTMSDIDVNSATGAGISLTGGGTVTSSGVNTIATTTGTALTVTNTTIGAAGLTFRSISSGNNTAAADPVSGVILTNTGSGGLTVTGNSSGNSGGRVTNTTTPGTPATIVAHDPADATGGTIQNTTGDGIRLNNVQNVSLTRMQILNSAQSGIFGTQVNGFQLVSSFISNNGNNVDEVGLKFTDVTNPGTVNGLTGTALGGANPTRIINSTVRQSGEFNVEIVNRTGTLTDLLVDGSQFTDTKLNAGPADADGFNVEMQGTSAATVRLTNSYFANNFTQGAQLSAIDSATLNVTVTSSTFTNNNEGFICNHSGGSDLTCTVGGDVASQGSTFLGEPGDVDSGALIVASTGSSATSSASQTTRIKNNHVTAPANMVNHSVIAFMSGTATPGSVNISNNTVNHVAFGHAILVDTPDNSATPQFGVTANDNAVTNNAPGGHGVLVQARQSSTACVLIQNNTGTVDAASSVARARASSVMPMVATLNLKQGVSSSTVAATVIADNNPGVTTSVTGSTLNVVANGACTTPTP